MNNQAGPALLAWFDRHKRDLPWRRTRDPYAIWISEIMLQQTRVAAVLDHYARWMHRFPTVSALAEANEPEVLALWSGLGYYRRARMLHRAAKIIAANHNGKLPHTAAQLAELPGIGPYTSAAIAGIAFGEPIAVVDGNVTRVLTRTESLKPATKAATIREIATHLLNPNRPGDSNQAIMELGATVCLPRSPLCLACPIEPWCQTRGEHPVTARKPLTPRAIAYALTERPNHVLLQQRPPEASLMAAMWELPETEPTPQDALLLRLKHAITVTNYTVTVISRPDNGDHPGQWFTIDQLPHTALTGLTRKVLRRLGRLPASPLETGSRLASPEKPGVN